LRISANVNAGNDLPNGLISTQTMESRFRLATQRSSFTQTTFSTSEAILRTLSGDRPDDLRGGVIAD
jgi:hypothetical protein